MDRYRSVLRMGHGHLPEDTIEVQVCREMHWTHDQYIAQPQWFVDTLIGMLDVDAKESEKKSKKK